MKIMRVSDVDQFNLIFDDLLCFSGMPSEEIYYNMWCVSLEGNLIQSITLEQLKTFLDRLIQNREQQLKCINLSKRAVFYMWFDQQALQLRFNVLSDEVVVLPFECKVHIEIAAEVVLSNFITTVKEVALYGDNIEFFNNQEYLDEDEEQVYVLDVFVKELKSR